MPPRSQITERRAANRDVKVTLRSCFRNSGIRAAYDIWIAGLAGAEAMMKRFHAFTLDPTN
jgi:hypothetical protein